jgi:alginate O-acetyltransferase complex protein AlgJ
MSNDHFFQRNRLVHWIALFKIGVLRETAEPLPGVIIGSDGWLYYTEGLRDYEGIWRYGDGELASMAKNVDHIQALLKAQGIPLLVVVAPDKQSVYPEYLPAYVRRLDSIRRVYQIAGYFREHASTPLLDLTPTLVAAKGQGQLFRRTDTHWTSLGAYFAWREIHGWLSAHWLDLGPAAELSDFTRKPQRISGDLAKMLTMDGIWQEDLTKLVPPPSANLDQSTLKPRLLVFGDSFTGAMLPFLGMDFSHVRFDLPMPKCIDFNVIKEDKPAIVIWLLVERFQDVLWCSPLNVPGE